ncbi:MAG: helix-turn-helix transcriptional regulator [Proteobacteria bacterium]|nr:helix-turn-helix transcriptional regulator [Pseudomonadota bacterium]
MDTKQMIGVRIAEMRSTKGMTQEHLAGKMGISSKYLSSIERGKENPTLKTLITLSEALNVDLGELFRFVQFEDASKRKSIVTSLVNNADDEQLRLAFNILSALIKK